MKTVRVKIADLTGPALDWAVAVIEYGEGVKIERGFIETPREYSGWSEGEEYSPSTKWRQGGPLIDGHVIYLVNTPSGDYAEAEHPKTKRVGGGYGANKLIAAMRAIVAAHTDGDTVEVPAELLEAA